MYDGIISTFRENASVSFVYLIGANGNDGPIKIGRTSKPIAKRLRSLQTGNPHKLKILEEMRFEDNWNAKDFEWRLHQRFKGRRLVGEWFAVSYDQVFAAAAEIAEELGLSWNVTPD